MKKYRNKSCIICKSYNMEVKEELFSKPVKETDFLIPINEYKRVITECKTCGIFANQHDFDLDHLYDKNYNSRTYENKLSEHFDKIMSLPYKKSDNKHRVDRINKYFKTNSKSIKDLKVLDIGSGLCVFLAELKKYFNDVTCIDPSAEAIAHAKNYVGIENAFKGSFDEFIFTKSFDLITLNKVLEHVKNPLEILLKAKSLLKPQGCIYIEIPDGYNSSRNGGFINREEFYIEHNTIFNFASIKHLVNAVKLKIQKIDSIHEPSDKYTIYAFLSF